MVDFMCQLNWTTSARYLVKYTLGVLYQSSQEKCAVTATAIVVLIFSPSGPSLKQHHRICTLEPILDGQLGSSFDSAT